MKELSDKGLVEAMLVSNEQVIQYFFFERCMPMFVHIIRYIFDYRSRLTTWLSVVAIRFFQKKEVN